jgi:beta-glucosidase
MTFRRLLRFGALAFCISAPLSGQNAPRFRDARLTPAERARDLLGRMTRDEKFWQLYMSPGDIGDPAHDYRNGAFGIQIEAGRQEPKPGAPKRSRAEAARADAAHIAEVERWFATNSRLGIPIIPFEEGVHGLTREGATMFPQAIALAATWDTALMGKVATAIGREARSRGIRQLLSPVINVVRDVRWGRVEETYGEDALLTTRMALSYIRPIEQMGVVTTPKHFIANVGEGGRDSYPIEISERQLREVYFPPFKGSIAAGARSVMTSYNSVDGTPATQSRYLITDMLRREWKFPGFVISDAAATGGATVLHMTEPNTPAATRDAFNAGLDVVFQSSYEQARPYLAAFTQGLVRDSVMDAAVLRVLTNKFAIGLFDEAGADPARAAALAGSAEHVALAREASRESIVLLRNTRNTLPLRTAPQRIAVIGADAEDGRIGGYSAPGAKVVTVLDAIRERAALVKGASVRFARGPGRITRAVVAVPATALSFDSAGKNIRGIRGEYFDNNALNGTPRVTRTDEHIDFGWTLSAPARGIPFDWYSVRWSGRITVPKSGVTRLGVEGNDGFRLWVDDSLVLDDWMKRSAGSRTAAVTLAPNSTHRIRLEYFESTGNARVRLVWDAGADLAWQRSIDSAVAVARASDVAVVVAGLEEGEFRDRARLSLPGHQEALIQAVAATGKPVVVVLIGGSAITMDPWLDKVGAVLDAWYPGEEGGHAIADVLFGDHNPSGRLPITFPVFEGQLPLYYDHKPTGRGDDYTDLTGQPLFPFGFGLSYTTFAYSGLTIDPAIIGPEGSATVRFTVTNSGARAGAEVVQLYLRDVLASVAQPIIALKDFARVQLAPGESREVTFTIGRDQLQLLDRDLTSVVEPGVFRVMIGASSKDIRLRGELTVR